MVISEIVKKQRDYFRTGVTRPLGFRIESLKKLQAAIRRNEAKIAEALMADLGKVEFESYLCETGLVLDEVRFFLKHLDEWSQIRRVRTPLLHYHSKCYIVPEPYGVALIMSPWNYPFNLCMNPLIGAIAAGNCAVVKPSIYAKATSHVIADIVSEAFPPEYVAVVEGGRQENTALLQEKFDYIFFTGSVAVGKTVMEAAAKTLTPVTLELGGKSPVIVDKTADIKLAARRIVFGKVLNAGQTCVAPDYLLIEKSVRDAFIEECRHAIKRFFPDGDMSEMVTIVSEKHYQRKKEMLQGQNAVIGGGFDDSRRFIEPTILTDVDPDSLVMQEEIFAPILPVLTWDSLHEAIDFINARPKPLALYLFTTSRDTEKRVFDACSFGGGCVNDTLMQLASPYLGFGGVGSSGMGQYHGKASFDTFTHYRSILNKSNWLDLPIRYFPYTEKDMKMTKMLLK